MTIKAQINVLSDKELAVQRREGRLADTTQYPWEEIVSNIDTIFTFQKGEYTSDAAVRSAGMSYISRHKLNGVLHVMQNKEDPDALDVQFEPAEAH